MPCPEAILLAALALQAAPAPPSRCAGCHASLSERLARPVARAARSAHTLAGVGCAECHGGDPSAPRGGAPHAAFPGHPTPIETAAFCGRCHAAQRAAYDGGPHARLRGAKPAVSCVDCHGAHDVGNAPAGFRLAELCGSCHGLEYLPKLPAAALALVEAGDRLADFLSRRYDRTLAAGDAAESRAIQRALAAIVHPASLEVPRSEVNSLIGRIESLLRRPKKPEARIQEPE